MRDGWRDDRAHFRYKQTLSLMSGNDAGPAALNRRRRSWSLDEKRRIFDESLEDGASIAEVARRHDLNTNQLFTWRRQFGLELTAPNLSYSVRPDGAYHQWRKIPPRELSIDLVADERFGWVTRRTGAS